MALVTESWGDRQLARMRGLKGHKMTIIYDYIMDLPKHGALTACRVCGAAVTVRDQEKHDEWHEQQKPTPPEPAFEAVFSEGTGVAVTCPHCGSINCTFRDEFVTAGKRKAILPFFCTKCENKFTVTFEGTERWTGMVTESV